MKILLDMDGVIADFIKPTLQLHGRTYEEIYPKGRQGSWDADQVMGLTPQQFWAPLHGRQFWADIPKTPEADAIVKLVTERAGEENVFVCSTPSKDNECVAGKMDWIDQHYPQFRRRFIFTATKELCSHHDNALIDDREQNVQRFRDMGGRAFLVPRPWNSFYAYEPDLVALLADFLYDIGLKGY